VLAALAYALEPPAVDSHAVRIRLRHALRGRHEPVPHAVGGLAAQHHLERLLARPIGGLGVRRLDACLRYLLVRRVSHPLSML
jgi:hypothetical protein